MRLLPKAGLGLGSKPSVPGLEDTCKAFSHGTSSRNFCQSQADLCPRFLCPPRTGPTSLASLSWPLPLQPGILVSLLPRPPLLPSQTGRALQDWDRVAPGRLKGPWETTLHRGETVGCGVTTLLFFISSVTLDTGFKVFRLNGLICKWG